MSDRGMKKWAPYKSLIEQEVFINKMRVNKSKIEKPILCDEEMEKINYYLTQKRCKTLIFSRKVSKIFISIVFYIDFIYN